MNNDTITINSDECYFLCVSAVRHALGRRTYIVGHVAQTVARLAQYLTAGELRVLIRDIDEQARLGFGADCDRADWMALREHLIKLMEGKRGE